MLVISALVNKQAAELAKRLLCRRINAADANIRDSQVSRSATRYHPNQPTSSHSGPCTRTGPHGASRGSTARGLHGVRRYRGTRRGQVIWVASTLTSCVFNSFKACAVLPPLLHWCAFLLKVFSRESGGFGGRGRPWRDSAASSHTRRQRRLV